MSSKQSAQASVKRTVLIVGEGHAEVVFLQHCKSLFLPRNSGLDVKIRNARGKGASHVVDHAIGQSRVAAHDACYALLDEDTDWTPAVQKRAKSKKVQVLLAEPCLEALLLQVHDQAVFGKATQQLKTQFKNYFDGAAANDATLYDKRFDRNTLNLAAQRIALLESILTIFQSSK